MWSQVIWTDLEHEFWQEVIMSSASNWKLATNHKQKNPPKGQSAEGQVLKNWGKFSNAAVPSVIRDKTSHTGTLSRLPAPSAPRKASQMSFTAKWTLHKITWPMQRKHITNIKKKIIPAVTAVAARCSVPKHLISIKRYESARRPHILEQEAHDLWRGWNASKVRVIIYSCLFQVLESSGYKNRLVWLELGSVLL